MSTSLTVSFLCYCYIYLRLHLQLFTRLFLVSFLCSFHLTRRRPPFFPFSLSSRYLVCLISLSLSLSLADRIARAVSTQGHRLLHLFLRIPCDPFDSLDSPTAYPVTSTVTFDEYSLIYMKNSRANAKISIDAFNMHIDKLIKGKYRFDNVSSTSIRNHHRTSNNNSARNNNNKKNFASSDKRFIFWPFRSANDDTLALILASNCNNLSEKPCNQASSILHRSKFVREAFTIHTNAQLVIGDENLLMSLAHSSLLNDQISSKRFTDNGELKYSLRSLTKFAPWIRYIYLGP